MLANRTIQAASGGTAYQIQRSLRIRDGVSAHLTRTPSTSSNRKTWTWSGWVKRTKFGANCDLFGGYTGTGNGALRNNLGFLSDDTFQVTCSQMQLATDWRLYTTQIFRDPSAWYHMVVAVDTTQAVASDRAKVYVNGSQVTSFTTATYPTQNYDGGVNFNGSHYIGRSYDSLGGNSYSECYVSEMNFIDGQALTPTSFGQIDPNTGVWSAKKYSGTYGTNGFYLNFSDTTNTTTLCTDKSGNTNNWTPTNVSLTAGATYDSMLDVPLGGGGSERGNYCTLNPLQRVLQGTISDGNLRSTTTGSQNAVRVGTQEMQVNTYYEYIAVGNSNATAGVVFDFLQDDNSSWFGATASYLFFRSVDTLSTQNCSATQSATPAWSTGDTLGLAWNVTARTLSLYVNNVLSSVATVTSPSSNPRPLFANYSSTPTANFTVNFGQQPFTYTPPTGFKALHTGNLPQAIIKKPNQYFDTTAYTGTSATQTIINNGAMQPDLVWIKHRSDASHHRLQDSVRGIANVLFSSLTNTEYASPGGDGVTAINGNGFTLGAGTNVYNYNNTSQTYVAWQWKKGGTPGFDIVTYTGDGANRTIAHAVGSVPKLMIVKGRTTALSHWYVYHASLPSASTSYVRLNTTNAYFTDSTVWNSTAPTSSLFSLGTNTEVNANGINYVNYLFSEVAGYSKIASYTGNGSTDGPFVFTGFKPRYIMFRRSDSTGDWIVQDTTRASYNPSDTNLYSNLNAIETVSGGYPVDILSNGFKIRNSATYMNASGGAYIFVAFAEAPFKNALAR